MNSDELARLYCTGMACSIGRLAPTLPALGKHTDKTDI